MTESTRNSSKQHVAETYRNSSKQHVDLSCSRILRDNNYLQTFKDCFDVHDPPT